MEQEIGQEYAMEYTKKFIRVVNEFFPSYKIIYGGSATQETGESIISFDDLFPKTFVAGFLCNFFKEELDDGQFFHTRNMGCYIRRHRDPQRFLTYFFEQQQQYAREREEEDAVAPAA